VKTDTPLKVLFQTRPQDLLPIIGETGARVLSAGVIELPSIARRVDMVLSLGRGRRRYLHHMEFQDYHRGPVAFRCFEYATRLVARFRLPVVARHHHPALAARLLPAIRACSDVRHHTRVDATPKSRECYDSGQSQGEGRCRIIRTPTCSMT
jgi:hypothetical protein